MKETRKAAKGKATPGGVARRVEYDAAWGAIVLGLLEARNLAEVEAVPSVAGFVDELLYICQTIGRESPPDSSLDDLARRLSRGFPRAASLKNIAATPGSQAKAWVRRKWVEFGPKFKSRIAFARWAGAWVEDIFHFPVEPQKTIVERWINDLP